MKKIIIVGHSDSLLQKENGHKIDSFDIVVRMSEGKIKGYEKYVGTKTDVCRIVWENHFSLILDNKGNERFIFKNTEQTGFKTLLLTHFVDVDNFSETAMHYAKIYKHGGMYDMNTKWVKRRRSVTAATGMNPRITHDIFLDIFLQLHPYVKNISIINRNIKISTAQSICNGTTYTFPSNGIYTINHMIDSYPNDQIYITGFDGFKNKHYFKTYETCTKWHDSMREQLFLKRLLKTDRVNLL